MTFSIEGLFIGFLKFLLILIGAFVVTKLIGKLKNKK